MLDTLNHRCGHISIYLLLPASLNRPAHHQLTQPPGASPTNPYGLPTSTHIMSGSGSITDWPQYAHAIRVREAAGRRQTGPQANEHSLLITSTHATDTSFRTTAHTNSHSIHQLHNDRDKQQITRQKDSTATSTATCAVCHPMHACICGAQCWLRHIALSEDGAF